MAFCDILLLLLFHCFSVRSFIFITFISGGGVHKNGCLKKCRHKEKIAVCTESDENHQNVNMKGLNPVYVLFCTSLPSSV